MKKIFLLCLIPMMHLSCKTQMDPPPNRPIPPVIVLPSTAVSYSKIITSECNFIRSHQLNDGAFTMSANRGIEGYKIVPYFSNIAARALLENPTPENITAVKNWMIWYMTHLNADGSVYDYMQVIIQAQPL